MAQKHQDAEGELQPPPVPEDIARESEVPSEGDSEHGHSDDGSDAPRSQNVPAAGWPLLDGPRTQARFFLGRGATVTRTPEIPPEQERPRMASMLWDRSGYP
jgi:hypothetical protein